MTPFGFVRQPTAEECKLVGRTISYSEPYETDNWRRDWGDYVIQTSTDDPTAVAALAEACHQFALGDDVYIIPAGIYVEE
jgi:hypothetical protein